jgi:transcriptional regulator with XRE-family HTH domain
MSQRDLAARVGVEHYTLISQLESGCGRIPPDRYIDWATALEIAPDEFARALADFYDAVSSK